MPARLVVRAFHPSISMEECVEASGRSITLFGVGGEARVRLCTYRVTAGIVYEANSSIHLAEPGWSFHVESLGPRLCRYHEGPRGDPLRQKWCHLPATRGSWCQRHASSTLAMYERCTAGNDYEACRAVDAVWRDEEYIVYMVYHGAGFKIGVTRAWRFYTRILEQPHLAAVILARLRSALEARRLEKRLASRRGFNEGIGVPRSHRLRASLLSRMSREEVASKLAAAIASLGLSGDYEAVSLVDPQCPPSALLSPLDRLEPGSYRYRCMWGGVLVLERSGSLVAVKREAVQHRLMVGRG